MSHPFKHFHTVCVHRRRVIANGAHMGIFWHCLRHDLSKFSYTEFHESAKYYTGDHSPVRGDRMAHHGFSLITQHHVGRNKHHWQYWVDFEAGRLVVMTMPWKYASEMICDMLSAAKTYHPREFKPDSALLYFERLKSMAYMTQATSSYLEWCLQQYATSGWKHLKKKETKEKYREICAALPQVEVFEELRPTGEWCF